MTESGAVKKPKVVAAGSTEDPFGNGRRISASWTKEKTVRVRLKINDLTGKKPISLPLTKKCKAIKQEEKPDEWPTVLVPARFYRELGIDHQPHFGSKPNPKPRFDDGWLYIFVNGYLWRELRVSRTDKGNYYYDVNFDTELNEDFRVDSGQGSSRVLLPLKVQKKPMSVEVGFSQVQWSWKRIESFGGASPKDIKRIDWYLDEHKNSDADAKKLREERLTTMKLADAHANSYSTTTKNLGPIDKKNLYEFKVDLDKKIPAIGIPDSVGDAEDLAFTYQESWRDIENYIVKLKNPVKTKKHPFSPWFESAVLANQYFFSEVIKTECENISKSATPLCENDIKKGKKWKRAQDERTKWQSQLSLKDIQIALGTKKRAELRKKIVESKIKLVEFLSKDSKTLQKFIPAFDDYCTLPSKEIEKNNGESHSGLIYKLGNGLFSRIADHEFTVDIQLETKTPSKKQLFNKQQNDPGFKLLGQIANGNHPLSSRFFISGKAKSKSSSSTPPKKEDDFAQSLEKFARISRRASQFIGAFLLDFATVAVDKQNANAERSLVKLISTHLLGTDDLVKLHVSFKEYMTGELIGDNAKDYEIVRSKFLNKDSVGAVDSNKAKKHGKSTDVENAKRAKEGKGSLDTRATLPTGEKVDVIVRDLEHKIQASTNIDLFNQGKGFQKNNWKHFKAIDKRWKILQVEVWVARKATGVGGFAKRALDNGLLHKKILPSVFLLESINIYHFYKQADKKNYDLDSADMLNLAGVIADFAAIAAMMVEERLKFKHHIHEKVFGKTAHSAGLIRASRWARGLGLAASAYSAYLSFDSMMQNIHEGDDALIGHALMTAGFIITTISEAVSLVALLSTAAWLSHPATLFIMGTFGWIGLGIIVLGALLLIWIFTEDTPMEEWLANSPFSIVPVKIKGLATFTYAGGEPKQFIHQGTIFFLDKQGLVTKFKCLNMGIITGLLKNGDGKTIYLFKNSKYKKIAKVGEIFDFDANGLRHQRFGGFKGGLTKVNDKFDIWNIQPQSCYDALRNVLLKPSASLQLYHHWGKSNSTRASIQLVIQIPNFIENKTLVHVKIEAAKGVIHSYERVSNGLEIITGSGSGPRTITIIKQIDRIYAVAKAEVYIDLYGDQKFRLPLKAATWSDAQEKFRQNLLTEKNISGVSGSKSKTGSKNEKNKLYYSKYATPDVDIIELKDWYDAKGPYVLKKS